MHIGEVALKGVGIRRRIPFPPARNKDDARGLIDRPAKRCASARDARPAFIELEPKVFGGQGERKREVADAIGLARQQVQDGQFLMWAKGPHLLISPNPAIDSTVPLRHGRAFEE
jgi:hypothetical protein